MRDFLTGISIILIVVLTTILVAPYFVDWNSQRDFLEARLSHALGQKVTVGGAIDLKLLPTPYLVLDQVVVGGDEASVKIGVRHLNLELAAAPLLHGEVDIVEARLREPTIRISLEKDHRLPPLPAAPAFSADVRFDRIQVSDGTLAVADPQSGRTFVLDHLDLDADAGSFAGPFKIVGAGGPAERRTSFRLATAAAKDGRAHAHLSVDETPDHAGADFDGTLDMQAGDKASAQSFDGKLVLSGHVPRRDKDPMAWKLSGQVRADSMQAQLEGGELRLGGDEAGLTLQADAHAVFGEAPKLAIDLKAKQLDIDRLSGVPAEGAPRAPPQLPEPAELRDLFGSAAPPLATELNLAVETATYGGETLSGIAASATLGDTASHSVKFTMDGPRGSHLAADGSLSLGADPSFSGHLDMAAEDLPRTLDWVQSVAPSFPWNGRDVRFERVKLSGPVKISAGEASSDELTAAVDRTKLSGKAKLTLVPGGSPKLVADLASEALDIETLPSLGSLRGGSSGFDLDLKLDAKAIKVSHVGDGGLDAGHIRVDLGKTGDRMIVRDLQIDGLDGASLSAKGELAPGADRLSMAVDAGRLGEVAGLVRQLAPGAIADALASRASSLAPAKLQIEADFANGKDGTLAPRRLSIVGNLAKTKIDAKAKPETDDGDAMTISASLQSPDSATLLRQLGANTVPLEAIGPGRLTLSARGPPGKPLDTKVETSFGATKLGLVGRFDLLSGTIDGAGDLSLQSPDLTPLLQTLAVAFPDMLGHIPADAAGRLSLDNGKVAATGLKGHLGGIETSGTVRWDRSAAVPLTGALAFDRLSLAVLVGLAFGHEQAAASDAAWSQQPFAVGLIDPPHSSFALKGKVLEIAQGLEARDASFNLGIASNTVSIAKLAADLSGGRLEGEATLRRDQRQATLEGKLALDGVEVRLRDTLKARLDAKLDFAGGGTSSLGLVSSLAGSGAATATGLRVTGADPAALTKIFDEVEADVLAVDQDAVVRAYQETAKGSLSAGTVRFGVSLAAGIAHFEPATARETAGPSSSKVDAAFDLPRDRFTAHVTEALTALPKDWSGPPPTITIALEGPLGAPHRSVDVSGFLNTVASRALAREAARIEAYELDVRERAFFNARLQWERRREEERQKAEDDARKAEAERKARLEAARQDRLRKQQAEKAARDEEKAARDKAERDAREPGQEPSEKDRERQGQQGSPSPGEPGRSEAKPGEPTDPSSLGRY